MNRLPKLLLVAALLLVGVGVVLAVVQPGGLGDEEAGTETAQPATTEPSTDTDTAAPSSSVAEATTTTEAATTATTSAGAPGDGATPTTTGGTATPSTTTAPATTSTTRPAESVGGGGIGGGDGRGSGLGGGAGTPADLEDGLADTGGTSAVGIALLAGLIGLGVRRRTT